MIAKRYHQRARKHWTFADYARILPPTAEYLGELEGKMNEVRELIEDAAIPVICAAAAVYMLSYLIAALIMAVQS